MGKTEAQDTMSVDDFLKQPSQSLPSIVPDNIAGWKTGMTTRPRKAHLDELVSLMKVDEFPLAAFDVPVEFFVDGEGRKRVIAGHHRVYLYRCRAEMGFDGYTLDMEVDAAEVFGATPEELQIRAAMANLIGRPLADADREKYAKILRDNGMPPELVGL